MHTLATVTTVIAVIFAASAQQYPQSGSNYVDDYPYDQPSRGPSPRSYSSNGPPPGQAAAPPSPKPTPVAILKQINKHNEDGSYTYGFEGADGSFKIETKLPTGDVKGKYGFVDDTGKVRVVEYGANQFGFQPAGEGITVAPPTLVDETTSREGLQDYDYQQQAAPAPVRSAAPPPPPPPRPIAAPRAPTYPATHTQALYAPPQIAASIPAPHVPKPPIFSPAPPPQQQQPILRPNFDEPPPPSNLYNQGPAQFNPAPVQERRSPPQPRSQSGGILDQLARDYALPQGVAPPLHDISFGYY